MYGELKRTGRKAVLTHLKASFYTRFKNLKKTSVILSRF